MQRSPLVVPLNRGTPIYQKGTPNVKSLFSRLHRQSSPPSRPCPNKVQWGFPKSGVFLGIPIIRTFAFLRLYSWVPYFYSGKVPIRFALTTDRPGIKSPVCTRNEKGNPKPYTVVSILDCPYKAVYHPTYP